MPAAGGRRAWIVVLLILLLGVVPLGLMPVAGPVRVAEVSLLWWYAGLAAPLIAAGGAVLALSRE